MGRRGSCSRRSGSRRAACPRAGEGWTRCRRSASMQTRVSQHTSVDLLHVSTYVEQHVKPPCTCASTVPIGTRRTDKLRVNAPNRSTASSKSFRTSSSLVTSPSTMMHESGSGHACLVSRSCAPRRANRTSDHPARASVIAVSRPIPINNAGSGAPHHHGSLGRRRNAHLRMHL